MLTRHWQNYLSYKSLVSPGTCSDQHWSFLLVMEGSGTDFKGLLIKKCLKVNASTPSSLQGKGDQRSIIETNLHLNAINSNVSLGLAAIPLKWVFVFWTAASHRLWKWGTCSGQTSTQCFELSKTQRWFIVSSVFQQIQQIFQFLLLHQ